MHKICSDYLNADKLFWTTWLNWLSHYQNMRFSSPCIAETAATSIISELGDSCRFQSACLIGIDLRHDKSGKFLAKEHITKLGNPYARKILFMCILNITSACHSLPCPIADFYQKIKQQSQTASTKLHTIAAINRLIRTM